MKLKRILILYLLHSYAFSTTGQQFYGNEPLAHTYSIVAIDEKTGDMGVAVQSHWFSVGTIVAWGEAGVGVVATQSFVNPAYGPDGLAMMKMGFSPKQALNGLIAKDEGEGFRQVAFLNKQGEVAAHTGSLCIDAAGHLEGDGYSVQANMMDNAAVWPAMAAAFEASANKPLAQRLMDALLAAEAAGGDIRGKQSAAILVVKGEATGNSWEDRIVDLRIDDHPDPLKEMQRLLKVHAAYQHMNAGDLAVEHGEMEKAKKEYGAAEAMFPDNLEMKYWHAIALANNGEMEEAGPLFKEVFNRDKKWKELTERITKNGLLTVDANTLKKILSM